MGHKADDWISLLQCIWGKINWIRGKWTLKQYYFSLAAHHMDTMLSLMSIGHQKPRGRQLSRDLLFQTGDRWGGVGGAIFRWNIGWMHTHFVGVRWKCFRLFWDPLWSTEAVAAVQLWSAFLADVCVQTFTPGSLCVRIPPYSCNCGALWWCVLRYYFRLLRVVRLLCVFQENFSTICSTTSLVIVYSVCVLHVMVQYYV